MKTTEQDSKPQLSETVVQLIQAGRTISAIKQLREETGMGLKEAKHRIDKEVRIFRLNNPNHPAMQSQRSWWPILFFLTLVAMGLYWIFAG